MYSLVDCCAWPPRVQADNLIHHTEVLWEEMPVPQPRVSNPLTEIERIFSKPSWLWGCYVIRQQTPVTCWSRSDQEQNPAFCWLSPLGLSKLNKVRARWTLTALFVRVVFRAKWHKWTCGTLVDHQWGKICDWCGGSICCGAKFGGSYGWKPVTSLRCIHITFPWFF